jgi:hypothetical protein
MPVAVIAGSESQCSGTSTFRPAASLAQAYRVFEPEDEKVYEVGADADQPLSPVDGVVADSFTRYPVTPVALVAVHR